VLNTRPGSSSLTSRRAASTSRRRRRFPPDIDELAHDGSPSSSAAPSCKGLAMSDCIWLCREAGRFRLRRATRLRSGPGRRHGSLPPGGRPYDPPAPPRRPEAVRELTLVLSSSRSCLLRDPDPELNRMADLPPIKHRRRDHGSPRRSALVVLTRNHRPFRSGLYVASSPISLVRSRARPDASACAFHIAIAMGGGLARSTV